MDQERGTSAQPAYWLDLFTPKTWTEFLAAGGSVSGFREGRLGFARQIKPGDFLLCYLTGVSRFIGLLEVTSEMYRDDAPIWSQEAFPLRFRVRTVIELKPETAVPIKDLLPRFSFTPRMKSPRSWEGKVQGSPNRWDTSDGELIVQAMREADANPTIRPFDPRLLQSKANPAKITRKGLPPEVAPPAPTPVPEPAAQGSGEPDEVAEPEGGTPNETREHSEMEALLARLGHAMGFDIWIDPSDRHQVVDGTRIGDLPGMLDTFALHLGSELTDRIRRIDVLWVREEAVVAAFEVEHSTQVYSGLLRMSDLLALQPNLNVLLFIVAPEKRASRVESEITRPTFRNLRKPLAKSCRYISYERLRERFRAVMEMGIAGALRPEEFLDSLSRSFEGAPASR